MKNIENYRKTMYQKNKEVEKITDKSYKIINNETQLQDSVLSPSWRRKNKRRYNFVK